MELCVTCILMYALFFPCVCVSGHGWCWRHGIAVHRTHRKKKVGKNRKPTKEEKSIIYSDSAPGFISFQILVGGCSSHSSIFSATEITFFCKCFLQERSSQCYYTKILFWRRQTIFSLLFCTHEYLNSDEVDVFGYLPYIKLYPHSFLIPCVILLWRCEPCLMHLRFVSIPKREGCHRMNFFVLRKPFTYVCIVRCQKIFFWRKGASRIV